MKKSLPIVIALIILFLVLSACRSSTDEIPVQETTELETAYPSEDNESIEEAPDLDSAYPITQEDLELLYLTWNLSAYSEDGIVQDPMVKSLRFNADGNYEMTTENGSTMGNWTARLFAMESTLSLNSDSGETLTFEIVDLEEALLKLRSWRENVQIEEQFQPLD